MKKGKDRSAKAFFSVEENAREMVKLAFSELGIDAEPKDVKVEDPVVSYLDDNLSLEKLLDKLYTVTLKDGDRNTYCIIGLENQSKYDPSMLIRAGISSLVISGWKLKQGEALKPNYIVVVNMSDHEWKGPRTLSECFSKKDLEFLGPSAVDVRIVVIDPHTMSAEKIRSLRTDLSLVLGVIKYKKDKDAFCDYIRSDKRFTDLKEVTMRLISELIDRKLDMEERNMCKALDDLERIRLEEGEAQGFARGEAQGFTRGEAQGFTRGEAQGFTKGEAQGLAKGRENAIFELRRKGNLSLEVAAEALNLSLEEYARREERFFS